MRGDGEGVGLAVVQARYHAGRGGAGVRAAGPAHHPGPTGRAIWHGNGSWGFSGETITRNCLVDGGFDALYYPENPRSTIVRSVTHPELRSLWPSKFRKIRIKNSTWR